jgi:hypothetical protein
LWVRCNSLETRIEQGLLSVLPSLLHEGPRP